MVFLNFPRWPGRRPKFIAELFSHLHWKMTGMQERRLDRKFGIETAAAETGYLSDVPSPNRDFAVPYEAIQLDKFHDMISAVRRLVGRISKYHFVDLGSGKARALIYAAESGFCHCTGVEFSAELHAVAEKNVEAYRQATKSTCRFSLHCMDAVDFEFPDNDMVLFMYNPFSSEVMQPVAARLRDFVEKSDRDLFLLYRNPTCSDDFRALGLTRLESNESFQIYRANRRLAPAR
jgi:SAM-dependent methyltransferase